MLVISDNICQNIYSEIMYFMRFLFDIKFSHVKKKNLFLFLFTRPSQLKLLAIVWRFILMKNRETSETKIAIVSVLSGHWPLQTKDATAREILPFFFVFITQEIQRMFMIILTIIGSIYDMRIFQIFLCFCFFSGGIYWNDIFLLCSLVICKFSSFFFFSSFCSDFGF